MTVVRGRKKTPMIECHPDVPVGKADDGLLFNRYVDPLMEVLSLPETKTPLTVGIFGPWGSGKSTLLKLIGEAVGSEEHKGRFILVDFNPWVHRGEPNMLVPLLHRLHDALSDEKTPYVESAKRIFDVLARLAGDTILKALTCNAIDLEKLDKLEEAYLKRNQQARSEMHKLRGTLGKIARDIGKRADGKPGPRLVITIDDLDRCQPDEIIGVLESVKLFLDIENVIVILAVDKEVIDRGVEVRYGKFGFGESRAPALGAEYLEKMVQLPLTLLPLSTPQVDGFVTRLKLTDSLQGELETLRKWFLPNPRKIKRVLNILALTDAIVRAGGVKLNAGEMKLVARLVCLQVQDGDLYARIARQPELLIALESYYEDKRKITKPKFDGYRSSPESVKKFCETFHRPDTYLRELFDSAPFGTMWDADKMTWKSDNITITTILTLMGS